MPTLHPHLAAAPARASQLLADFIASPVGMRPTQHLALIRHLHGLATAGNVVAGMQGGSVMQWIFDGCKGEPWNEPSYEFDAATGIALLEVSGPLIKGYDDCTAWLYEAASIDRISREIAELDRRDDLRALVLHLKTPGGMSTGMPELVDQVAEMSSRRLIVAHTSDTAASNGMRLAMAATKFFPAASSTVGCIGTYIALYNYTKMLEDWGIKLELYRAGKYKAIGLEGKDTTAEEAAWLQSEVNRSNEIFRGFVRSRRPGVPEEAMEGQWFDGNQALDYGLADQVAPNLPAVMRAVLQQLGFAA